jgi:hypothetical protein
MKIPWDKVWDIVINKAHVVIGVGCQGYILWEAHHGRDIGPNAAQTVNWFYLFLAGHFGASQIWPDKKDGQQ